jgi:hypothetical protein
MNSKGELSQGKGEEEDEEEEIDIGYLNLNPKMIVTSCNILFMFNIQGVNLHYSKVYNP